MDLNENKIRKIVEETVKDVIKEQVNDNILNMDISKLGEKFLKSIYFDFRMVPYITTYDDKLNPAVVLKEVYQEILEPDDVVFTIKNRFHLPEECFKKVEAFNNISVYVLYATIGINDKLISEAMEKLGYFVGVTGEEQTAFGMKFRVVQFEPKCYHQKDETDNIKSMYDVLFHWTPSYNVEGIMNKGLIPCHKNSFFNYPPRTYLIKGELEKNPITTIGMRICYANNDPRNDGKYTLLVIDLAKINDDVRFYMDPNAEVGIYTETSIPPNAISIVGEKDFNEGWNF